MDRYWIRKICKNYMLIVLTVAVMIYFGFANSSLYNSFASELSTSDTQEESTETELLLHEEMAVQTGSGSIVSETKTETNIEDEVQLTGSASAETEAVNEGTDAGTEVTNEAASEEADVGTEAANEGTDAGTEVTNEAASEEADVGTEATYECESTETEATGEGSETEVTSEEEEEPLNEEENLKIEDKKVKSVNSGVAKITYTYMVTDTEAEDYGEYVTETEYFAKLSYVFAGIERISETLQQNGEDDILTVELCQNIELTETIHNTNNSSFILDMHGYTIILKNGAYLDLGAGRVTFFDQMAATSQNCPGGIVGDGAKLLAGSGEWIFCNGWYENTLGNLFGDAASISILDGYFISPTSFLGEKVNLLNICGGFFSYDESCGVLAQGEWKLPDGKVFAKLTQFLWEREVTGYCLAEPDYMVSVGVSVLDEAGNPVTVIQKSYYKEFSQAWEQAVTLSLENDGSVATVNRLNEQISVISLSSSYTLRAGEGGKTAAIALDGMQFVRQSEYDGNMFTVDAGHLILKDCILDCAMEGAAAAWTSAIRVNSGKLVLNGSTGTIICNNVLMSNTANEDKAAGIYLASGALLSLCGKVCVTDNFWYDLDEQSGEQRKIARNVYLEEGASIEISGNVMAESKIGISHGEDMIAGLTTFGKLDDIFFEEIKAGTASEEEPDVSSLLSVFVSDQNAFYFPRFDSHKNLLFWDNDVLLLPEAGVLRVEFIFLLVGLFGFVIRNIPRINRCMAAERYLMGLSVVCVLAGVAIGLYHIRQEQMISEVNMSTLQEFYDLKETKADNEMIPCVAVKDNVQDSPEEKWSACFAAVPKDGREYGMVIEIPALEIKLPVLTSYSEMDMKTSPCIFSGAASEDNLVIVGHNYESQFGKLNGIELGTEVLITLADGTTYSYQVSELDELEPDQVEKLIHSYWDLTMLTCNYVGDKRVAVRCKKMD